MCRTRTEPRTSRTPNPSDFKAAFCRRTYCNQKQIGGIFIAKLVVAEKPSVAMSYAKVLGATSRQDGYLEGNGYLVSWCIGHLVELAPPNVYDEKFIKWSIADLPILPQQWQYLVSTSTKKQFGILQKLMNRPDVDSIVCATDAGREGELIFRLVYQQAGCKKPFSRLWLSSMEENAIREGFAHLKPSTEYDALYNAALCRERADWMVGINASRLFSCLYGQPLAVGRVMTPVLAMTVVREAAIAAFVPEKFYTVALTLADGGTASSKRFAQKADAELPALFLAKYKTEDDYIGFILSRFVRVLYKTDKIDKSQYYMFIYGASDDKSVNLIRSGVPLSLIKNLSENNLLDDIGLDDYGNIKIGDRLSAYSNEVDDYIGFEISQFLIG